MTDRTGRQKTLITKPYMNDLLRAAVDLIEHATGEDCKEARLIRAAIRECLAGIAETEADAAVEVRLATLPAAEAKRVRSEVEARRTKLRALAAAARKFQD